MSRTLAPRLLALAALSLVVAGCADDDDPCATENCPTGFTCEVDTAGEPRCVPSDADAGGTITCESGEHQVENICVPDYEPGDVCDPLRLCRQECGTRVSCLDACEDDRSTTCASCADDLLTCETSNNCESGPYVQDCCFDQYCTCFPEHPNCGNVPPCDECQSASGDDAGAFSACAADEPACATCLDPFFDCQQAGGSCEDEFCACATCP